MKNKIVSSLIAIVLLIVLAIGYYFMPKTFGKKVDSSEADHIEVFDGNIKDYTQNPDGTWECDGNTYKYRLEITGRMNNAACDSTFVYLSNIEEITFDQAWKAAGLSSNSNDYFEVKDAVLVEWTNKEREYDR